MVKAKANVKDEQRTDLPDHTMKALKCLTHDRQSPNSFSTFCCEKGLRWVATAVFTGDRTTITSSVA